MGNEKLTTCKACDREIAKGVKKCIHCGKDQRSWFGRHKILTGIGILFFLIFVASLGGGGDEEAAVAPEVVATEANGAEAAPDAPKEESEPKDEFAVNERIQFDTGALTVLSVEKSSGNDFDVPKDGNEYVIVTVQIENTGEENMSYNSFDFKMKNSQGQITDSAFSVVDSDTSLQSGELAPGGSVTGTIPFEQPKDDAALQLQYEYDFWSEEAIKINLQ